MILRNNELPPKVTQSYLSVSEKKSRKFFISQVQKSNPSVVRWPFRSLLSSGSGFSYISHPTLWCDPPHAVQVLRSIVKSGLLTFDSTTRVRAQQYTTLYLPTLRMKQSWDRNRNDSSEVSIIKVQRKKLVPNTFLYQRIRS